MKRHIKIAKLKPNTLIVFEKQVWRVMSVYRTSSVGGIVFNPDSYCLILSRIEDHYVRITFPPLDTTVECFFPGRQYHLI